ncbi:MAG: GNAT family N-acetyltransferase [Lachnospiraceae bacterium]|nr:GNAT family N-acetyltransferase [Lachnospiraceae bacterium]
MIRIIKYREEYYRELLKTDKAVVTEITYNKDVIKDSVIIALTENEGRGNEGERKENVLSGIGYILKGSSAYADNSYTGKRFLHAVFKGYGKDEAEISELLLDKLISIYREDYRDHTLRLWCRARNTAYLDFLVYKGFYVDNTMLIMEFDLKGEINDTDKGHGENYPDHVNLSTCIVKYDKDLPIDKYIEANADAFGIPDSRYDIMYRIGYCGAGVYTVYDAQEYADKREEAKIIAAVTVWSLSADDSIRIYATENVFCRSSCRRRGIMRSLLSHVLKELKKSGKDIASLNVYGDNKGALFLYLDIGYEVKDVLLELHLFQE